MIDKPLFTISRPCGVAGCTGTMTFHDRLNVADAPHTLEWPWSATWVCDKDRAHFRIITDAEYREIRRDNLVPGRQD